MHFVYTIIVNLQSSMLEIDWILDMSIHLFVNIIGRHFIRLCNEKESSYIKMKVAKTVYHISIKTLELMKYSSLSSILKDQVHCG